MTTSKGKKLNKEDNKPYMRVELKVGKKTGGFVLTKEATEKLDSKLLYSFFKSCLTIS